MVAEGQFDGGGDQPAHPGAPVHFHGTVLRQVVKSGFELMAAAVLAGDGEARGLAEQVGRHAQGQLDGTRLRSHHRGRQQPFPFQARQAGKRTFQ